MKVISLLVVKVSAIITANLAFVWAIVEFALYLAKDKEFNWWSVWAFAISVIVAIALVIATAVSQFKKRNSFLADNKQRRKTNKKSRYEARMDEIAQKRVRM